MVINVKKGRFPMVHFTKYPSPLGELLLTAENGALTGLWMDPQSCPPVEMIRRDDLAVLIAVRDWLDRYFAGKAPSIAQLPLCPAGTEFQRQVWEILCRIPYGEALTYGEIAKEMAIRSGKANMSAQAVGQAAGRNPISIIIPCHRVVGSKGNLTGYSGGLDKKIWLLRHEGWLKEDAK